MDSRGLAAWVDGEMESGTAERVAAHLAACPVCAAQVAALRKSQQEYHERMRRYRAATTPGTLPPAVWQRVRADWDRLPPPASKAGQWQGAAALAVAATLCFVLFLVFYLRPAQVVPVAALLSRPAIPTPLPAAQTFVTGDADAAARWLSGQLGQEVPTISLALMDASLIEAQVDKTGNCATLLFRSPQGAPVTLYVFSHARVSTGQAQTVSYRGDRYQVAQSKTTPNTLISWQNKGQVYAAVAPLPPQALLPYAHEMSRRCLPGH